MNKIVRQHYPVDKLPLDLRESAGSVKTVTVTIEVEEEVPISRSASNVLAEMMRVRDQLPELPEVDAAARIRKLRDEWDR